MKLTRTLHLTNPMMHGDDVRQLQHLLTSKGFPVEADGVFGPVTAAACVDTKTYLKFKKALPSAGQKLVDKLTAAKPYTPPALSPQRQRYVATLKSFFAQRGIWDYFQIRPIPHKGHKGRVKTDCSGGVTYAAETADCPDPNGFNFNGLGNTATIMSHCTQISKSQVEPGDLVCYGEYPGHHVTATVNENLDQWSHGHQGDPEIGSLQAQIDRQADLGYTHVTFWKFMA